MLSDDLLENCDFTLGNQNSEITGNVSIVFDYSIPLFNNYIAQSENERMVQCSHVGLLETGSQAVLIIFEWVDVDIVETLLGSEDVTEIIEKTDDAENLSDILGDRVAIPMMVVPWRMVRSLEYLTK